MELALFTAYQVAKLTTYGEKKLKPLGKLLGELKRPLRPPRAQTSEEKIAALRAIMATMGASAEKPRPE